MMDESDEGERIYLDVTMWFKSDDLSTFHVVREFIKECKNIHSSVQSRQY